MSTIDRFYLNANAPLHLLSQLSADELLEAMAVAATEAFKSQ